LPTLNPEQCQLACIEPASLHAGRSKFDRVGAFRSERVLGCFDRRSTSIFVFPLLARRRSNTIKDRRQKRDSLPHNLVSKSISAFRLRQSTSFFATKRGAMSRRPERREKDRQCEAYRLNGNFDEFGQCVGVHYRIHDNGWYDDNENHPNPDWSHDRVPIFSPVSLAATPIRDVIKSGEMWFCKAGTSRAGQSLMTLG